MAACAPEEPRHAAAAPDLPPVEVAAAPATLVHEIATEVPTAIEARHQAALASRVSATIESVRAEVGDRVRAGQVLVLLDAGDVEARVAAAEAALRAARSHHGRVQSLFAREAATAQEMEAAEADRDSAEAALRAARAESAYVRLAAPFAGRVTARHVSSGDLARPGEPLLVIQNEADGRGEGGLRAVATVAAEQMERIAVGSTVGVALDDGTVASARVTIINTAGDPASRRFLVKADLPPGVRARPGSFARLRLPGPIDPPLVASPAGALFERGSLTGLFVVEEGHARLRWVSPGEPLPDGLVIVRAGLQPGEWIVLEPSRVTDGTPVRVAP
jgi:RND family efflux transporter MFP subunit